MITSKNMQNDNKKQRLAVGYVNCKRIMKENNADFIYLAKVEDIMLASIRTLHFLWDNNADKATDYILESVLMHMALVASEATGIKQGDVYMEMIKS